MSVQPDVHEENAGDRRREPQSSDNTSNESAEGWKFLWDSEKEFDQEKVDSWKDELNNLLVFAGLFSAVVTAFAVESYQLLQQDPAEKSNELLERISLQLASFTVGPGFINSTQALTPPTPFQPDPINTAINALWFLSLTLSLLAAFFAIAAQQWLRSLLLPRHLSLTNRMRLRQSRHEALILCQIPQIISFLPVTLQVAVLMFLIGLYLFLRSLQYTIATTFAVVAGIPFLLYGLSLFIPLFWPSCTYKSPIIPVASAALRWAICISAWVAFFAFVLPLFLLLSFCFKPTIVSRHLDRARQQSWHMTVKELFYAIIWPIFLISTRFTETIEDFWVDREVRWLRREKEKELSNVDLWSLSWAPQSVPRDQLRRLVACIGDLPLKRRCTAVVHWTMFELGDYGEAGYSSWFVYSPIKTELLKKVDHAFADDYKDLLMLTLPKEWTPAIWREAAESLPLVLVLLMQIVKTSSLDGESRDPIVRHLIEACNSQEVGAITREKADRDIRDTMRYPTVCLYGSIEDEGYNFSAEETSTLMTLATTRIQECSTFEDKLVDDLLVDISDTVFGLTATSLIALSQQPTTTDAHTSLLPALLSSLDGHVTTQSRELRSMARVCSRNPDEPLLITPRAITSVSRSLIRLRETDRIPPPAMEQCDSLVANLTSLCTECPAFASTLEPLQRFRELKKGRQTEVLAGSSDGQGYGADSLEKTEGRSPRNADAGHGSLSAVEVAYK